MSPAVCPRRSEIGAIQPDRDVDEFRLNREGVETCAYCGSISGAAFLAAVEAGAEVIPTDKSYKAYIDLPHPQVGQPCVVESASFMPDGEGWIEVTAENVATLPLDEWQRKSYLERKTWVRVSARGPRYHGKFYFQHLDENQRAAFIEHHNAGRMKVGMPGHFYVVPFFAARAAASTAP